jgi:hypothetical protein
MGAANAGAALAGPADVKFSQSAPAVDVYDFVEVVLNVERPDVANPFTDAVVAGEFAPEGGEAVRVDGFCDAADGSVFRVRFMPTRARRHTYSVEYQDGAFQASYSGEFTARDAGRRGLVRVDPEYPWHFIWEGTGEHYFYNGTTAYWLVGWDDENIRRNLDRLHSLQVTRVRSALMGRVQNGRAWYENVFPTEEFSFLLNPWVAERPDSVEQPGFDVTRFNVAHWQKYERLLRHARGLDMVVSVIIYVDGRRPGVDPFGKAGAGGDDEQRYYRYAVARFAAFSNVMWDVTNEYQLFRDEAWADKMGALIKQCDPYDHLASVHGHGTFHFRTSPWADFAMYQRWDQAGGYRFLRAHRDEQAKTGRIIPQVNEEYGYEDHYPRWGGNRKAPARVADNRRRLAWEMYMAGCYQTTGERADTGTGWGPDTGGGWVNGRGDDSMTMLRGYGRIVDFFTSIPWWTLEPDDELIDAAQGDAANVALSHITYTRTAAGQATMYLDGAEIATATIAGDVSNWDDGYRLLLANELTKDRPWLGEYRRVAVYARPLSAGDVAQSFEAGLDRGTSDAVALYAFGERGGDVVRDSSGAGQPLHLTIDDGGAVRWLADGGLRIESPVLIASAEPATKLISAVEQSGAITIEAWVKPANTTQAGPARVVSLSADPGQRNFTLGQAEGAYEVRLRTTSTSANGEPSLWSPGRDGQPHPICASRSEDGDLAVVYFPAGGQVTVRAERLRDGLEARWYNPRTGEWSPAEGRGGTVYRTPDEEDWALLFRGE